MKKTVSMFLALMLVFMLVPVAALSVSAATHAGTEADPYSAADAAEVASKLAVGEFSDDRVYVKGIVKSFTDRTTFVQNLYLIDKDGDTVSFLVYSANVTDDVPSVAVGDTITVCGYLANYNGILEMTNKTIDGTKVYPEIVAKSGTGAVVTPDPDPTPADPDHAGTKADPYTASDATKVASALTAGSYSAAMVYVKGTVKSFEDKTTFFQKLILADADGATFLVYSANPTDAVPSIAVGDVITVYGYLVNYNGTPEMSNQRIDNVNNYPTIVAKSEGGSTPVDPQPGTAGTLANPYTAADATAAASALATGTYSETMVYVKGVVKSFTDKTTFVQSLVLADADGVTFLVYSANPTDAVPSIAVGDIVTVYGYLVNYNGTPEMSNQRIDNVNNYPTIVAKSEGGTVPVDPTPEDPDHAGTQNDPYTAADAKKVASALAIGSYSAEKVYVTGIVQSFEDKETYFSKIYLVDSEGDSVSFLVYSANPTDEVSTIAVGEKITVYGYLTNYNGTPEMSNQRIGEENHYPLLVPNSSFDPEKSLEDNLKELVGADAADAKYDITVSVADKFYAGDEIEVTVTVNNIKVEGGISQIDFRFYYDNTKLTIANELSGDKALECIGKLPSDVWDNLTRISYDENGIINSGVIEVSVLNADNGTDLAVNDGDITLVFKFKVNSDVEEVGFYVTTNSIVAYDWNNTSVKYYGNGSYAITKLGNDLLIGDINGDGKINARDYGLLKRFCLGTYEMSEEEQAVADINDDGKINSRDYGLLKRHCLGTYVIGQ